MTRARGKITEKWFTQAVYIKNPPISSMAHLVLLAKQYFPLDKSIYTEARMSAVRRKWIKQQIKNGELVCAICGKRGLISNHPLSSKRATLDHIIDISRGGAWNDTSNFQIACYRCNLLKSENLQKKI
jgi:5-methylcytosine-specific restriction endonuclease McrA